MEMPAKAVDKEKRRSVEKSAKPEEMSVSRARVISRFAVSSFKKRKSNPKMSKTKVREYLRMLAKTMIPDIKSRRWMTFWTEVIISVKEKVILEGLIRVVGFLRLIKKAIRKLLDTCTNRIKMEYFKSRWARNETMKNGFRNAEHLSRSSASLLSILPFFKASQMSEALAGFPMKTLVRNRCREFSLGNRSCLGRNLKK